MLVFTSAFTSISSLARARARARARERRERKGRRVVRYLFPRRSALPRAPPRKIAAESIDRIGSDVYLATAGDPFSLLPRRVRRTRARRISILLAVLSLAPLLEEKNPRQPRGRITRVSWNISRRAGSGCSIDFYFRFRRRRDRRAGIPASTPPPPPPPSPVPRIHLAGIGLRILPRSIRSIPSSSLFRCVNRGFVRGPKKKEGKRKEGRCKGRRSL